MNLKCKYCGGIIKSKQNVKRHVEQEENIFINGKEDIDYVVCKICGYRGRRLSNHIKSHNITIEEYLKKYPNAKLYCKDTRKSSLKGKQIKQPHEKVDAQQCKVCGEWHNTHTQHSHWVKCVRENIDKYKEGYDYIKCPECDKLFLTLGHHLKKVHKWDKDKIDMAKNNGLRLSADIIKDKRKKTCIEKYGTEHHWQNKDVKEKRKETWKKNMGVDNPFKSDEVKDKIKKSSQRRYGTSHPMQNEDVFIKQQKSAGDCPNGLERFFDEHTCDNIVYVGYGGRYIRTKTGVRKCGRIIKDLNPDFIVFSDNVLQSARDRSDKKIKLSNVKHRSRYVIELLGDYYHSEGIIGVPNLEHEKQIVEAYRSASIECLVLWEYDVLHRWSRIQPMVDAWITNAVEDMNKRPIYKKPTKNKVDGRLGKFVCPYGSGKKFRTEEGLKKWMEDKDNLWLPSKVENIDYVVCGVCGQRFVKLGTHIVRLHSVSIDDYLVMYPGNKLISDHESLRITKMNREWHREKKETK